MMEPAVNAAYVRAVAELPPFEDGLAPTDPSAAMVLEIHFRIADYFYREGWGIGGIGLRDPGTLLSAVGRQGVSFGGVMKWTDPTDRCATLFFGLIRGHPFHDANKRTAFLCALWQLRRGGRVPAVEPTAFEDLTVRVAGRELDAYACYRRLARTSDPDADVKTIALNFTAWTRPTEPSASSGGRGEEVTELIDIYRSSLIRLVDR